MSNRVLLSGLGLVLLVGCEGPDHQYTNTGSEEVGFTEQAAGEPTKIPQADAEALVKALNATEYKDIAVTSTFLYALTTTGIKGVAHGSAATLDSAPYIKTIQLDAIDYSSLTYGIIGARSKGSNPNAVLVLNATAASPTTVNLPAAIGTISALESRAVSPTVIRVFFKVPKTTGGSTIYEYEYNGTSLSMKSLTDAAASTTVGFTFVGQTNSFIGWVDEVPNYAVKYFTDGSPSISEAQKYERTYPGGVTTGFLTHGFWSTSGVKGISPLQLDFGKYHNSVQSVFALTRDAGTDKVAIVRLDLSQLNFNKTPTFTPTYWNASFQGSNNCYNYGTNKRTDTFAQPGEASGHPMSWPPSSTSVVSDAAVFDGLQFLGNPATMPVPPEGKTLIAAIVGLNVTFPDYHWYRKDRDTQYWTHKPGGSRATDLDQAGVTITDPRTAAWNQVMYDTFVGFFLADSNWHEGMGVENIQ
jgi:hypothetical protein